VVHVAGTNAKGSVIALMRAALQDAGYAVHVYTSPHLVRFAERVRLAGTLISDDDLTALLETCERVNGDDAITFFEVTTCAAFKAFADTPADALLLETGLGGRLDATNVLDAPALTVITPIDMDHQSYLGDTLEQIAYEKAGILKPGVPCVVGPQRPEAQAVLEDRARAVGAPLITFGRDFTARPLGGGFRIRRDGAETYLPAPALAGRHQIDNAAVACVALDCLKGFDVPGPARARAMKTVRWPARLQRLTAGPWLERVLPTGSEVWVDGGHNAHAAQAIADWAAARADDRPLVLVCGMLNNRDAAEFLKPLAPFAAGVLGLAIPGEENTHTARAIVDAARAAGLDAAPAPGLDAAVAAIADDADGPVRVLVCGSLYLAGHVLADQDPAGVD
jgi:dihydrofolate synthase/folylpolyglutamate synthase